MHAFACPLPTRGGIWDCQPDAPGNPAEPCKAVRDTSSVKTPIPLRSPSRATHVVSRATCPHVGSGDGLGSELAVGEAAGELVQAEVVTEGVATKPGQGVPTRLTAVRHHHPHRVPDPETVICRR